MYSPWMYDPWLLRFSPRQLKKYLQCKQVAVHRLLWHCMYDPWALFDCFSVKANVNGECTCWSLHVCPLASFNCLLSNSKKNLQCMALRCHINWICVLQLWWPFQRSGHIKKARETRITVCRSLSENARTAAGMSTRQIPPQLTHGATLPYRLNVLHVIVVTFSTIVAC